MLASLAACFLVASCANPSATIKEIAYGDPTKSYLGMSKEELISCAGQPYATYSSGATETLTYHYTGAGPVPADPAKSDKKKDDDKANQKGGLMSGLKKKDDNKNWTCTASFTFQDGRVSKIVFAHRDVTSPYAYQSGKSAEDRAKTGPQEVPTCQFSLPRCPKT